MGKGLRIATASFAIVLGAVLMFAGTAGAQDGSDAYVGAESVTRNEAVAPASASVGAASAGRVEANALAFTGTDVAVLALMGGVAVVLGGALLITRRRTAPQA
jgi:uncharacterized membrane protein YphA (DoxX/SURF4 family)